MKPAKRIQILVILAFFTIVVALRYLHHSGDDLASSYYGCKILAAAEPDHLYSQDPSRFDKVDDPKWQALEDQNASRIKVSVHPYVQTPLWAFAIGPICSRTSFDQFREIFVVLECVCFAALIWVIASQWAPSLFRPGSIGVVSVVLFASVPVRYALALAQTHILFLLPVVLAIAFARRFPIAAGALLAVAAAVKITPAYLVIYWFLTRRNKAAFSFLVCSASLVLVTILTTGWDLFLMYLHRLSETSNVLLVAYNNQSLSAWLMGYRFAPEEFQVWHSFPLPFGLKIACVVLATLSAVAGAWLDRRAKDGPPYGAIFTLIASTIFAPIAWSHYFFLLLIPAMMLLDVARKRRSFAMMGALALIVSLNLIPTTILTDRLNIIRPQFYVAIICLALLVGLSLCRHEVAAQHGRSDRSPAA